MSERKRLAILTPGFYEQATGGAELQTYLLAQSAKELGLEVHHIYLAINKYSQMPNNLNIHLYPVFISDNKFLRKFGKYKPIFSLFQIWKYLKEIKPDIIYSRGGGPQAWLAVKYSRKKKSVKSIWAAASLQDVIKEQFSIRFFDYIYYMMRVSGIKYSSVVLSQAEYQRKLLKENFCCESVVFKNRLPEPTNSIRKNDKIFKIVWLANLKTLKRPDLFVDLAESFINTPNLEFIMIGKNQGYKFSDRGLANLKYLGEKTLDEANDILSQSHVLVNTSEYEGFSNTFIQAWMRNVIVCSLNVDPDNILIDLKIGYCCHNMNKLKEVILKLSENRSLREEISARAKEYVLQNHSLERSKDDYKVLLMENNNF